MMDARDTILQEIEKLKEANYLIIVEGKKDKKALAHFGIRNVILLDKPLYAIVEAVAASSKQCIILTDLDKKGRQLYSKLNHDLSQHGVHIDNRFREFLFRKTKLCQIEGLVSYISHFG